MDTLVECQPAKLELPFHTNGTWNCCLTWNGSFFRGKKTWVGFVDVAGLPFMIEYLSKTNYAPVILRGLPVFNHYITPLGCFRSAFWLQSNPRKLRSIEKMPYYVVLKIHELMPQDNRQ